jgi:hypothetical protein
MLAAVAAEQIVAARAVLAVMVAEEQVSLELDQPQ